MATPTTTLLLLVLKELRVLLPLVSRLTIEEIIIKITCSSLLHSLSLGSSISIPHALIMHKPLAPHSLLRLSFALC